MLPNPNLKDYDFSGVTPYLFGRSWSVQLGEPFQAPLINTGAGIEFSSLKGTGLRTAFDIPKTSESASNKAKVEIYNMSAKTRTTYLKGGQLTLQVGYGSILETLYIGRFVRATSVRKGADIITTFELGDGEFELYNNSINNSYKPGTKVVQVIQDLVKALGLPLGTVSGITNTVYNKGFVASGGVKDILDKILIKQNLEWSVQNGVVQIIPISSHNGEEAVVVNQDTGMIGVPNKGGLMDEQTATFTSLINPKLVPGAPVLIQSSNTELGTLDSNTGLFSGIYKVRTAHFEGDTHDSKWNVTCECDPLTDFTTAANQNKGGKIVV